MPIEYPLLDAWDAPTSDAFAYLSRNLGEQNLITHQADSAA
jgi:hypothetical protein